MSLNDPKNWNIVDPFPSRDLKEIESYADRALALYARNKNKIGDNGHFEIFGAIRMLQGLEYHNNNFLEIDSKVERYDRIKTDKNTMLRIESDPERSKNLNMLKHEVIAYLNRLGQFQEFYESDFSKDAINGVEKTTIKKSLWLRHHYSAHRIIDKTEKSRTDKDYRLAMNFESGYLFNGKGDLMLQYQLPNGRFWNFNMRESHNEIMKEAFNIVKAVVDNKMVLVVSSQRGGYYD